MAGLGIEPSVYHDEEKNQWVAHHEPKPFIIDNVRCKSEEEAWAVIEGTRTPQAPPHEIIQRIAEQMAKASRKTTEEVRP